MDANKLFGALLAWCCILSAHTSCFAQRQVPTAAPNSTFYLNGKITLDSLTRYVHKMSGIRFSFNSSRLNGSKEINFPKGKYSFPMLLSSIRKTTSLSYTIYNGYVIFSDHPASQDHSGGPKKKIGPRVAIRSVFKKDTTDSMAEIRRRIDVDSINKFSAVRAGSDTSKSKNSHPVSGKPAPERPSEAGGKISLGNLHLNFGLQWILNLPVYGTKNYFTGTNGRNQAYNMLIPALWVGNSWQDKHEIMLRVRPVLEYFAGNKVLTDSTGRGGPSDSSLVRKTMTLIKTSGVAAGLQYNYNIDDQWSVGAGLEYHLQFSALVDQRTIRLPTGALLSESTASIKRSSPDWQYLKSSFIAGWFELAFQLHKFQTGAEIMMPVSNPAASPGKEIRSLNGQLFLRWRFK